MFEFLLKLWFDHQTLRVADCPKQLLFPAELVSLAAGSTESAGLWWDIHGCGDLNLIDARTEAAVFPPVPLRRWDRLALALPGEVAVDASVPALVSHHHAGCCELAADLVRRQRRGER